MLGNHMHGTTTSRILGGARLRRKHRDLPPLRPSLMLMLGADIPPAAPEQHKNLWIVASCGKANLPLPSVLSTSGEPKIGRASCREIVESIVKNNLIKYETK